MEETNIKILAIDDNKDNLITISALIKDAFPDYVVLATPDGVKGLKLAGSKEPDVILQA